MHLYISCAHTIVVQGSTHIPVSQTQGVHLYQYHSTIVGQGECIWTHQFLCMLLSRGVHLYQYLNMLLEDAASRRGTSVTQLTSDLHVYPDFHGNRSPLADPSMKGMVREPSKALTGIM